MSVYMFVCVCACGYRYAQRPEVNTGCLPIILHLDFWRQSLLVNPGLLMQQDQLVSEIQGAVVSISPVLGLETIHHCTWLFGVGDQGL